MRGAREFRLGKQRLHNRLTIVERTFQRDVVNVGMRRSRHLAALHLADAALRVHHEDVDIGEATERCDGRGAGVARSGGDHRRLAPPLCERAAEQPAEDLKRDVLEGERRAMEQLEQEGLGPDAHERRDVGRLERRIGRRRYPPSIRRR